MDIVIDHIKAGYGIKIFNYLNLDKADIHCSAYYKCYIVINMGKRI